MYYGQLENREYNRNLRAHTSSSSCLISFSFLWSELSRELLFLTASRSALHSAKAFCSFLVVSVTLVFRDLMSACRAET